VRERVAEADRRAALEEELGFWLHTAAQDMEHARGFAAVAPWSGQPAEAYLDRWLPLGTGGHVLAGPRYLGLDPELPFVGISASDRVLRPADRDALTVVACEEFAAFRPGFVMLTTADEVGAWPATHPEKRQVVGRLGDLRRREVPEELSTAPSTGTAFYDRYRAIHDAHVSRDPAHARHARLEERSFLAELADQGLVHDVLVDGAWAGVLAAERDARRGLRGATVVELILDQRFRGQGYGKHLSTLLARSLPLPDEAFLLGTIHHDNASAYRAALAAGRVDVGGEVVIPL
jgi:GNAT superfamily N-acetyltransferase